jgi:riboflavin synthase
MFTGIVEETGGVIALQRSARGGRLILNAKIVSEGVSLGDSIAVNGCCLTVANREEYGLGFDLLGETLDRTNLGSLMPGDKVNLERALSADGRLGGHFVQGHIDCASEVREIKPAGNDYRLEIALPPEFAHLIALKGSVAIDGISLTVAEITQASFAVWIIPHTWRATNLSARQSGDRVNLEFDILAKYLERMMAARAK